MNDFKLNWSELKSAIDAKSMSVQYVETPLKYHITALEGSYVLTCSLSKAKDITDVLDFETSYKPTANSSLPKFGSEVVATNFSVDHSSSEVQLNGASYTNLYSYSGVGIIEDLAIRFDSAHVYFKVEIDGRIVMEILLHDLEEMGNKSNNNTPLKSFSFNESRKTVVFSPKMLLKCNSSFIVSAKAEPNKTRKLKGYIIAIDKVSEVI